MHSSHMGRFGRVLRGMAVLVAVAALAGCGANNGAGGMGGMNHGGMGGMATANPNAPFDQQFIDMMVPHHQGAVEMAKIAQGRAEHPELTTLATAIIAAQDTEIGQMKGWRKAWFGSDATPPIAQMPMLPGTSHGDHTDMAREIETLRTAAPFDRAFLTAMIPHHESAIEAAKIAQQKATRPEIKTLAGSIIADQQREIDQMNGWMRAWYGK